MATIPPASTPSADFGRKMDSIQSRFENLSRARSGTQIGAKSKPLVAEDAVSMMDDKKKEFGRGAGALKPREFDRVAPHVEKLLVSCRSGSLNSARHSSSQEFVLPAPAPAGGAPVVSAAQENSNTAAPSSRMRSRDLGSQGGDCGRDFRSPLQPHDSRQPALDVPSPMRANRDFCHEEVGATAANTRVPQASPLQAQRELRSPVQSSREHRGDMWRDAVFRSDSFPEEDTASAAPSSRAPRASPIQISREIRPPVQSLRDHQSRGDDMRREAALGRTPTEKEDAGSVAESSRAPRASPMQSSRELPSLADRPDERQPRGHDIWRDPVFREEPTREEGITNAARISRIPQASPVLASRELRPVPMASERQSRSDIWRQSVFPCDSTREEGAIRAVSTARTPQASPVQASRELLPPSHALRHSRSEAASFAPVARHPQASPVQASRELRSRDDDSWIKAVARGDPTREEGAISVVSTARAPQASPVQASRELRSPAHALRQPRSEAASFAPVGRLPQASPLQASRELRSRDDDIWRQSVFPCDPTREEGALRAVSTARTPQASPVQASRELLPPSHALRHSRSEANSFAPVGRLPQASPVQASRELRSRDDDFWSKAVACGDLAREEVGVVQSSPEPQPQDDVFWSKAIVVGSLASYKDVDDSVGLAQSAQDRSERQPLSTHTQPAESLIEVFADAIGEANDLHFRPRRAAVRSCSPVLMTPRQIVQGHGTVSRELEDLRQRNHLNQLERTGQRSARKAREAAESRRYEDADSVAAHQARALASLEELEAHRARGLADCRVPLAYSSSHSALEELERSREFEAALRSPSGREAALRSARTEAHRAGSSCCEASAQRAERAELPTRGEAEEADGSRDAEQELLALWRAAGDTRKDELLAFCRGAVEQPARPEPQPAQPSRVRVTSASRAVDTGCGADNLLRDHGRRVEQMERNRIWTRRLAR